MEVLVVLLLVVGIAFAIAAWFVIREAGRLTMEPPPVVFSLDEAYEWVVEELPVVASLAKAYVSDAYFHSAAENIQIHGGIGFTWEHDAHLYFKRAKSSEILLGDATYHRELLAQRIGI